MATVNINGLSKAAVLAALYNASQPLGMGFLQYTPEKMSETEAASLLANGDYFDYVKGRVMKISLKSDELETYLYNRDNGPNAAEYVIEELRKK